MVELQTEPIKQKLSRQIRQNKCMTFADTCKEAWALEQELQDGEYAILSQRVTVPAPLSTTKADMEQLKGQIQTELQLMGEMRKELRKQRKTLSANLMSEVRMQLLTRELLPAPITQPGDQQLPPT